MRFNQYSAFGLCILVFIVGVLLALYYPWTGFVPVIAGALVLLGVADLVQPHHSIRRNYPVIGHVRWLAEMIRPEIRQYLIESDQEAAPFSRNQRSLVYARAKKEGAERSFGTQMDVYSVGYDFMGHSIRPAPAADPASFRILIGGDQCAQPYSGSVFNISAMSFGSLSANAIRALNKGAALGGFAHDTGEGGYSPYHREHGGDIIWELGSGYFGCRTETGAFDPEKFAAQAANPQIKMIEIKLSQGAKPGHGGILPAEKVSAEIAATRGVPMGQDCISPSTHSAFSTPLQMMEFIARLRELSGGKPIGFKLCIGQPWEFMGIVKAMLATGIRPDFIVVDGGEGGTGRNQAHGRQRGRAGQERAAIERVSHGCTCPLQRGDACTPAARGHVSLDTEAETPPIAVAQPHQLDVSDHRLQRGCAMPAPSPASAHSQG